MTSEQITANEQRARIVRELYELIAALDRRVPQVERVGEIAISRAASALRGEALKRIAALQDEADADAIASRSTPNYAGARTGGETNGPE